MDVAVVPEGARRSANVRDAVQAPDGGDGGWMNELSSKCTLWTPPLLFHVTMSPVLMVTSLGVKVLLGPLLCAVTVWLAARRRRSRHQ